MPYTEPTRVAVTQGAAGQTEIVAATAGTVVEVLAYELAFDAAGTFKFESANTALTGVMPVPTNGRLAQQSSYPLLSTVAGEALNITTGTAKAFGYVVYRKKTS